jgi:ribonuclease HI
VAGLTEGLKKGRPPNEQQLKSLQLLGLTWNDFVTVGDNIYKPKDRQQHGWSRVGREEEGTSSLRAELAALLQLILSAEPQRDLLALLDCQIEMTELRKWIGEGHRATLADKVNADILKESIETLRQKGRNRGSTFLVKVKAHRGEPLNEKADDNAEYGRRQDTKEWNDRTDQIL